MWGYAAAIRYCGDCRGGVPRAALTRENILFIVLVLVFAASALARFVRRPRRGLSLTFDHSGELK